MSHSSQKPGKAPEKSNFAQTCNLLSQYLKEKRSLGDISLGIAGKMEAKGPETFRPWPPTMNLLPNKDNRAENSRQNAGASSSAKSVDFFHQLSGSAPSASAEDAANKPDLRKPAIAERGPAQLTIFYGGQVVVFNDFPADKAKEIMELASRGNSSTSNGIVSGSATAKSSSSNPVVPDLNVPSTSGSDQTQLHLVERIARRASLHRFFAKRKDRVSARAPYQVNHNGAHPPKPEGADTFSHGGQSSRQENFNGATPKPDEEANPMLEEGQRLKDLDLKL